MVGGHGGLGAVVMERIGGRFSRSPQSERCVGAPWIITAVAGLGIGNVVSPTYEYGWVLMVVAGLLNCLVILDVYDIALGRK